MAVFYILGTWFHCEHGGCDYKSIHEENLQKHLTDHKGNLIYSYL